LKRKEKSNLLANNTHEQQTQKTINNNVSLVQSAQHANNKTNTH